MIEIDDNGNFTTDADGLLKSTPTPAIQNAKAELRCLQGTWQANLYFGRNAVVWSVSQSPRDRSADIYRIVQKYASVMTVSYDTERQQYNVQVA